jgi:signal transduction histidine kinase
MYEQFFFILLLLSGQLFFLYIFARERIRRKQIEETILLATHELRQPLQSLSLALETLRPRAKGRTQIAIENGLAEITKLGQHVRFLAEAFSQPTAAKRTQIPELMAFISKALSADFDERQLARIKTDLKTSAQVTVNMSEPLFRLFCATS